MSVYLCVFVQCSEVSAARRATRFIRKVPVRRLAIIFLFTCHELDFRHIKIINLQRNPEHEMNTPREIIWNFIVINALEVHPSSPPETQFHSASSKLEKSLPEKNV